jgi:hypothetical protein
MTLGIGLNIFKERNNMAQQIMPQKFEHDFFDRTYPGVVNDISVAFSEIVANAWDAGATRIDIAIPSEQGEQIIIKDNGSGMTEDEFKDRWMVFAYNRVAHQGEYIEYPSEKGKIKRLAYGRNGVGRHAMLCFDNEYTVITCKDGVCSEFDLTTITDGLSAFAIKEQRSSDSEEHGTTLIVDAIKKLPDAQKLKDSLSYRFLFDPEFEIYINGDLVNYQDSINPAKEDEIVIDGNTIEIKIYDVPEGEKSTASTGVAFWVGKRLVGNPSWYIHGYRVEDARRKFALGHIIVVNVEHLRDDVIYDWSGFKNTENVEKTRNAIIDYIRKYRIDYYKGRVDEVKTEVIKRNVDDIEELSIPSRYELKEFFDTYLESRPEVDLDELNLIVQALVNVLKARNGISLLGKLATLQSTQIDTLDSILSQWSIFDMKTVLDEIDGRLKVISAIEQLCGDKSVDELHTLHPLVTQAKWLFGVEYDTPNYISNRTLSTVIKEFFENKKNPNISINWKKRPDLAIAHDFSVGISAIDGLDENEMSTTEKVLIIELKKGSFEIKRNEMNQAEEYVDYIYNGTALNSKPKIKAFVVGNSIDNAIGNKKTLADSNGTEYGTVCAYTYGQLIKTAEKRLLNLKSRLNERYEEMDVSDYIKNILNEPRQMDMEI